MPKIKLICQCSHKANNVSFHLTPNPEKSNDQIFEKNPIFGHFGRIFLFLGKNEFFQKIGLCTIELLPRNNLI